MVSSHTLNLLMAGAPILISSRSYSMSIAPYGSGPWQPSRPAAREHMPAKNPRITDVLRFCRDLEGLCDRYGCDSCYVAYGRRPGGEKVTLREVKNLPAANIHFGMLCVNFTASSETWKILPTDIGAIHSDLESVFLAELMARTFDDATQ